MSADPVSPLVLEQTDGDTARLREILANNVVAADEAAMIEFVQLSRRILEVASSIGCERASHTARTIVDLAQDSFPPRYNFGHGANLQLRDLLVELQAHLLAVRTGDPFPA